MINLHRSLSAGEKGLVWMAGTAAFLWLFGSAGTTAGVVAAAQVAAAVGTFVLALLAASQVREMREARIAQERPQVIVDTDHSKPPYVYVVVRNIGQGAAKDISFEFSSPMESPESVDPHNMVVAVSEQPYFVRGISYLAPGAEIRCLWGSMRNLADFLRQRMPEEGITVTSRYRSLAGQLEETPWTVNPLLMASRLYTPNKGVNEVAEATEQLASDLRQVVDTWTGEFRVSTRADRVDREREQANQDGGGDDG